MLTAVRGRGRLRSESAFTLVELLVALAAGVVVVMGAMSFLVVVMHQSQRTFTRIDATRQARTALANIENELHSACVAGQSPIAGVTSGGTTESDASDLVFLSYTGTATNPTPTWHHITFNSVAGTLTDTTYAVAGTGPDWTIGAQQTTTTLLNDVSAQSGTPVFQYYRYEAEYTDSSGNVYWTIPDGIDVVPISGATLSDPLNAGAALTATNAAQVVEVVVNLVVGSSFSNPLKNATGISDPVRDAISLRLTTPPDYVPAGATAQGYGPCA